MGKEAKKKCLYFIAERPEEELKEYPISTMQFLADIPWLNGECSFTIGIVDGETLSYSRLNQLVEEYLLGWEDDITPDAEQYIKTIKDRSKEFFNEFIICTLDVDTGKFSILEDFIVRSCFKKYLHQFDKKDQPAPTPQAVPQKIKEDYYGIFTRELNKCFGKHKNGSLTFTFLDSEEGSVWDVERNEEGYFKFGPDMAHSVLFTAKLISFFRKGSALCVRVYTDQSTDGIPFKELYAFILTPDGTMHNMDYRMVEKAYNTDRHSQNKLDPEKNVVYCDLQNNKLPSFDLE